jgi:glycosyltransferase involved in cell wall biosynthesis
MTIKVWLITVGEPLPIDDDARLLRTGMLAAVLADRGHAVRWWTSGFDHFHRERRPAATYEIVSPSGCYELTVLRALGYTRNVSARRLIDHAYVASNYWRAARRETPPDVVLCSLPTLEMCAVSAHFKRQWRRPYVVDVRDLWPDIFERGLPGATKRLGHVVLAPYRALASRGCRDADGIVGITEPILEWGLAWAQRVRGENDLVAPLGYPTITLSDEDRTEARSVWAERGVRGSDRCIVFFGNVVPQFDLRTVIDAARHVASDDIKFVICGSGSDLDELRYQSRDLTSVVLPGRIGRREILALMEQAVIGLAPYRPTEDFLITMPNKIIEYLSGGLPVLTTLGGGLAGRLLREHDCGATYEVGDVDGLLLGIDALLDAQARTAMSARARSWFDREFRAEVVYERLANHLEFVAAANA